MGVGREWLVQSWSNQGPLRILLGPLSWGYRLGILCRKAAYGIGIFKSQPAAVPVVSIGNLTVGGTGKTPAALWLAERLAADGLRPAIVTRGYRSRLEGRTVTVGRGGRALFDVDEIGDEASLLASRFSGPVVCGADRVAAVAWAVEEEGAGVVVLDDGFQHWRLRRDLDLVLVDGSVGFGNRGLLPAGPLREPLSGLRRAHSVVVTKEAPGPVLEKILARRAPEAPVFGARLEPVALSQWVDGELQSRALGDLVGRRVVVVSGIAEPRSFYELLGQLEAQAIEVLEYPDHHQFTQSDWQRITQAAHRADLVVCTEKDLVKLRRYPFARARLVALRVDFSLAPDEEDALYGLVSARLRDCGLRAIAPADEDE